MAEIENPVWREAREIITRERAHGLNQPARARTEKITSSNKIRFHDRNTYPVSDKLMRELKKKVGNTAQNINTRNAWLEASKRKNYIHEYDRIKSDVNTMLNKDKNAIGIDALKKRMNDLREMAKKSVNWQNEEKHEIYKKQ